MFRVFTPELSPPPKMDGRFIIVNSIFDRYTAMHPVTYIMEAVERRAIMTLCLLDLKRQCE